MVGNLLDRLDLVSVSAQLVSVVSIVRLQTHVQWEQMASHASMVAHPKEQVSVLVNALKDLKELIVRFVPKAITNHLV